MCEQQTNNCCNKFDGMWRNLAALPLKTRHTYFLVVLQFYCKKKIGRGWINLELKNWNLMFCFSKHCSSSKKIKNKKNRTSPWDQDYVINIDYWFNLDLFTSFYLSINVNNCFRINKDDGRANLVYVGLFIILYVWKLISPLLLCLHGYRFVTSMM